VNTGGGFDVLLGRSWPLPSGAAFTTRQAASLGVGGHVLKRLVREGALRRSVKGVYVASSVVDDIATRAEAVSLVTPRTAVVTDRTAARLLGVDVLAPGDHLTVPPLSVFQMPGYTRVRNAICVGGERTFEPGDIIDIDGVLVTSPLRTALDLGRLLRRDHAIGALDGLLRLGAFEHQELRDHVVRFRGQRGVVQLRELAPLADARSESPAESVLRLRWLDAPSLPSPEPQITIVDPMGNEMFRLDLGVREIRYAAEYDGVADHTSPEDREYDERRRRWLRDEGGWTIDVLTRKDVFGPLECAAEIIARGVAEAEDTLSGQSGSDGSAGTGAQEVTARRWPPRRK